MSFIRTDIVVDDDGTEYKYEYHRCNVTGKEMVNGKDEAYDIEKQDFHISYEGLDLLLDAWVVLIEPCVYPLLLTYLQNIVNKKPPCNRHIPNKIKEQVLRRYEHKCNYCSSTENLQFDHIHPISKKGLSVFANLQILCSKCNRAKSNKIIK